ncbi:MAG: 4-hydroxyphenylpyruvate dioxygenase family protein [Phycisphaerae bacterium]
MAAANLGIRRVHSIEFCVHQAEPWLEHFTRGFGFQLVAASTRRAVETTGTRRRLLRCGEVGLILAEPTHAGSPVRRYLERHPEGVSRVNFSVADVAAAEAILLERHATPTCPIESERVAGGESKSLRIATPMGDVEYGFVEYAEPDCPLMAGMEPAGSFDATRNPIGLSGIDHLTANLRTLMPAIAFHEHVMGFAKTWDVQFHTEDIRPGVGTGLKSVVMSDAESGARLALNEPLRPRFDQSQVQVVIDLNRGAGIHHVAFRVKDICRAVDACRKCGIDSMRMPGAYYGALPGRIAKQGIASVSQPLSELEARDVLLDGDKNGYLLQAFFADRPSRSDRSRAGPLLVELIERCGATGFGEGNFRALFEAMSRREE